MNFTAIDFETANGNPASACSIGLIVVENSRIIHEVSYLLKPYTDWFSRYNIAVHGITPQQVMNAPRFEDIWHKIASYIENADTIVAHNAGFDMNVLKRCLEYADIACRLPQSACTVKLAKKKLPNLPNHRLNTVAEFLDIPLNHHDALSDARAAAMIMLMLERAG
ncbi:MAG: 3'-5' exonuclease [Bacteroidota bacterium]|nr:3'-5' exonuclease [Bacteroidota bacterium]